MQLLLVICAAVLVADADKRLPFRSQFSFPQQQRFAQRQTASGAGGQPEDLTPPSTSAPAPPGQTPDPNAPYPPSGQPASAGPYPPSGWKPEGQRLELPNQQKPSQQYGGPEAPQQQYGAPQPQPGTPPSEVEPVEPNNESPEQAANTRLRHQVRQQRLLLQRLRQQLRDQQQQLEQLRTEALPQSEPQLPLRQQFLTVPQGSLGANVQYSAPAATSSAYSQEPLTSSNLGQTSFVARLQFMDVPQVNAPVYSYTSPLVQVS